MAEDKELSIERKSLCITFPTLPTTLAISSSEDGKPSMYQFNGGYYSFNDAGAVDGCHYYVKDYQGNNRMVVNAHTDSIEQVTHYYPFGGVMADISTGQNLQKYKYGNKELDRTYGLDLYDYHARQMDSKLGCFTSIDPLAEKYYSISPYAYCAGDPVNLIDRDGREPGFTEEVLFALRHPIAAKRIGAGVTKGMQNISTNATRFATRGNILYGSNPRRGQEDRGSENGAFRHALWQATITSEFGEDVAKQAGDAHEDNPNIDMNQTIFDNIDDADQSVDLHNNVIGRQLGANLKGKGMQVIAISVLNFFAKNGLYVAKEIDGKYIVSKSKLDSIKYKQLLEILTQLNNNGRAENEQQEYDLQQQDYANRNEALQNAL